MGYYDNIENAGGFIIKDLRKFLCLNKSPAHLMAGSKVPNKKLKPGLSFGQIRYLRTHVHAHTCICINAILARMLFVHYGHNVQHGHP